MIVRWHGARQCGGNGRQVVAGALPGASARQRRLHSSLHAADAAGRAHVRADDGGTHSALRQR